jgi:hypothetical protein
MATGNCANMLLCPRVRMVCFLQTAYSNSVETVEGEVCCSLSPAGTRRLAPQHSVSDNREDISVGVRRDCLQVGVPLCLSRLDGLHGIQVVLCMQTIVRVAPIVRETEIKKVVAFFRLGIIK